MSSPDFDLTTSVPNGDRSHMADKSRQVPSAIGRYRIERVIGEGGFGLVYLARDEQLERSVALKVPHPSFVKSASDAELYRTEARTVANLDHPTIVPVYDIGSTEEYPYYVVSKFVEGADLAKCIKQISMTWLEAAELVAVVADALHYAHKQGLVHRDIKPSNILIANDGKPYIVDFGLALKEENIGKGPKHAGTPSYMSPEQVRGEGHRVDGRTDVFSLGVVLYELLVGRKPFSGSKRSELLEQIARYEPKPPRQYDDQIPKELERICQKAMAKRAAERYSTAKDFAEDLRFFLNDKTLAASATSPLSVKGTPLDPSSLSEPKATSQAAPASEVTSDSSSSGSLTSSERDPIRVVPKGLRSFDQHDSDFFLELLPGARDREGLPDSLRFWKQRIEAVTPSEAFSVGLICGPSGCGKSSLVKAGLLPRLDTRIQAIYIEATADIETKLLHELRRQLPVIPQDLSLRETLAFVRQGGGIARADKVLIVLDQFEQWLHANNDQEDTELVHALRQCDGGRLQCLVMVRDDFWMAVIRFMQELEVRLVEGENTQAVDLFPTRHARKVLAAYGRAYDELPDDPLDMTKDQKAFLKQAVDLLADNGRVICVRLALFAEMTKRKPWTPATLKQLGGATGVGVTFLDETFSAATATPQHRYHQKAARRVLNALLPNVDTDIKGKLRSEQELQEASGYANRPRDFEDLLQRLDGELRLITPTDPDSVNEEEEGASPAANGERFYQLSHDYLVPAIREWLTRKRRETRRGRAELRLADRCSVWNRKPESRHLPSSWEYLRIKLLTDGKSWSEPESKMMQAAGRHHGMRWLACAAAVCVVAALTYSWLAANKRRNLVAQTATAVAAMQNSSGAAVPYALRDLDVLPKPLVLETLQTRFNEADSDRQLPLAYALAHYNEVKSEFLVEQIAEMHPGEVNNLVNALAQSKTDSLRALQSASNSDNYRHKSRIAIIAWHLGNTSIASDMSQIEERPDPSQRTFLIDKLANYHGDITRLASSGTDGDDAFLSATYLGLGGIPASELTTVERAAWIPNMLASFNNNPDPCIHNSAAWALKQWNEPLPDSNEANVNDDIAWQMNSLGMTLIRMSPSSFERRRSPNPTLPTPENMILQTVKLTTPFLIASQEVSVRDFQQFIDDSDYDASDKPKSWPGVFEDISPTPDNPVQNVNWEDAVLFCNWLSHREKLTPRYKRDTEAFLGDWEINQDANGYRLLTAAEWEYACRAGSKTKFSSGPDEQLLHSYAVFSGSATEACGSKRCNAWGLFDMHGNVWEWCEDRFGNHEWADVLVDPRGPASGEHRVDRGGCWNSSSGELRSSYHNGFDPKQRHAFLGFRVARTLPTE